MGGSSGLGRISTVDLGYPGSAHAKPNFLEYVSPKGREVETGQVAVVTGPGSGIALALSHAWSPTGSLMWSSSVKPSHGCSKDRVIAAA